MVQKTIFTLLLLVGFQVTASDGAGRDSRPKIRVTTTVIDADTGQRREIDLFDPKLIIPCRVSDLRSWCISMTRNPNPTNRDISAFIKLSGITIVPDDYKFPGDRPHPPLG